MLVVADRDDNQVSLVDTATLAQIGTVKVGTHPFGVAVDAEGRRAYAANVESDDVSVVDLAERRLVGTVRVGRRPYVVALVRSLGFMTDQYSGTVTVFRPDTLEKVKRISMGDYPEGIEASSDGRHVYVANWQSNTVSVIDSERLAVEREIEVGDGPRAFGTFLRRAHDGSYAAAQKGVAGVSSACAGLHL